MNVSHNISLASEIHLRVEIEAISVFLKAYDVHIIYSVVDTLEGNTKVNDTAYASFTNKVNVKHVHAQYYNIAHFLI